MDLINIHYKEEEKGEADGSIENSHGYHIPHKIIGRVTIIVLIEYYCVPGIMLNTLYIYVATHLIVAQTTRGR